MAEAPPPPPTPAGDGPGRGEAAREESAGQGRTPMASNAQDNGETLDWTSNGEGFWPWRQGAEPQGLMVGS